MRTLKLISVCIAVGLPMISNSAFADDNLRFFGYARYGAAFQDSDEKRVTTAGALNGNATGRLGNEDNGGEFGLTKGYTSDLGDQWDIVVMFDHYSQESWAKSGTGGVKVKKAYASVTNFVDSQPELKVWAGRDFHQRPQTGLNDYFWMTHDGQGAGFYNLNLGGVKLDFGAVGQVQSDLVDDNGRYAITSKLHNINLFDDASVEFYANYGFASKKVQDQPYYSTKAYQLAADFSMSGHHLLFRYADNAKDSVFELTKDQRAWLVSFNGASTISDQAAVEYLAAYQFLDVAGNQDRANYNVIVRPTYNWDSINSTWLEAGYSVVDYKDINAKNSSWKVTFSQNIVIGSQMAARPMLRFYTTLGKADNEFIGFDSKTGNMQSNRLDTLTFGAMFEAWW
ncbi:carbohydrate porin [Vibrio rhizosphaerae]|uniref:Carbohydrate porin n=2 Tax=Vibrio rhizosphaerae TaxID=398736 RepID=A0ABU4IX31_9VIBR|nr:carbohydrate porin [Vibrio rhizosphaerae]MDW6093950.1 carbohydrate porin [Vibrio rhizosphaerae]